MTSNSQQGTVDREIRVPAALWKEILDLGDTSKATADLEHLRAWAEKAYSIFVRLDKLPNSDSPARIHILENQIAEQQASMARGEETHGNLTKQYFDIE